MLKTYLKLRYRGHRPFRSPPGPAPMPRRHTRPRPGLRNVVPSRHT